MENWRRVVIVSVGLVVGGGLGAAAQEPAAAAAGDAASAAEPRAAFDAAVAEIKKLMVERTV